MATTPLCLKRVTREECWPEGDADRMQSCRAADSDHVQLRRGREGVIKYDNGTV